jgi:hypothetical protein
MASFLALSIFIICLIVFCGAVYGSFQAWKEREPLEIGAFIISAVVSGAGAALSGMLAWSCIVS